MRPAHPVSRGVACAIVLFSAAAGAQVRVVDVIPRHMSNESFPNAEPSLAVNPRNPARMAMSAYTVGGDLCSRSAEAPIFVSADTGAHWSLVCKIRATVPGVSAPGDITLRWSDDGSTLFAALLWPTNPYTLEVFQTPDPLAAENFVRLHRIRDADQPDMAVMTFNGRTLAFVAADFMFADRGKHPLSPGTAAILVSRPKSNGIADSTLIPVEQRNISGVNYAIRVAAHASGVVYAVFYSPRPSNSADPFVIEDVVVVRDDGAATGKAPFTALRDLPVQKSDSTCTGRDGLPGFRVARCAIVPYPDDVASFGNQRRVSANLSVAIDPRRASTVWVAWADSSDTSHYILHVRRSEDRGQTWTDDLLTISNATNPALSVTADGTAGFLFQELQGAGTAQRWITRLVTSGDGFKTKRSYTLATTPSNVPAVAVQPYIGDYIDLHSVGNTFHGVFSAANTPDTLNFPNGVVFQRNVDLTQNRLLNAQKTSSIGISIDPFFFSVGPLEHPECAALRAGRNPRADDIGCK